MSGPTSADLPPLDALALLHQSLAEVPEAQMTEWLGGVRDGVALSVAVVSGVPGDTLLVGSEVIRSGAEIARARVLAMEAERGGA